MSQITNLKTGGGGGGGIMTIDGNIGSISGATVHIVTDNSTVIFDATSSNTLTLDFAAPVYNNNILMGSAIPTLGAAQYCIGIGIDAMANISDATSSIAIGRNAMGLGDASDCVCIGDYAGYYLDNTSAANTIIGFQAGINLGQGPSTAVNNILIGYQSGFNFSSTESNNIVIGNLSVGAGLNNTTVIGQNGTQSACFIAGIDGVNVGSVATVVTENSDQLGTAVLTAGSGITITPGANTITIAASGGSGVSTLTGNSGTATPSAGNINIVTSNSTVKFIGSGDTLTQDFSAASLGNNIIMGCSPTITSALNNVGIGLNAFQALSTADNSVAIGVNAMINGDASNCVCIGDGAGGFLDNTSNNNTLIGYAAGQGVGQAASPALNNTAIGASAGSSWVGAESNNICIGSVGVIAQNATITIGENGTHTSCFVRGIAGVTVTGTAVLVSGGDQLGVAVSSRKYKENIEDMGDISSDILSLRPVTFTLKDHEDKSTQYGLIAEEVAEIFPGLVVNDKEGKPQTVKYHELPALLLNELQKSVDKIAELEARLSSLEAIVNDYN